MCAYKTEPATCLQGKKDFLLKTWYDAGVQAGIHAGIYTPWQLQSQGLFFDKQSTKCDRLTFVLASNINIQIHIWIGQAVQSLLITDSRFLYTSSCFKYIDYKFTKHCKMVIIKLL